MPSSELITLEQLKELLFYDPETGIFLWKKMLSSRGPVGKQAGTVGYRGYRQIKIFGKLYTASRLAWFYVYGAWPSDQIDHINRKTADDRIANLKDASPRENSLNRESSAREDAGIRRTREGTFQVLVNLKPKFKKSLGTFKTYEEAISTRRDWYQHAIGGE